MNTFRIFQVAAIAILMSSPAIAATDEQNQGSTNMPMMQHDNNGSMMQPGMTAEQYQHMPMMQQNRNGMMTSPGMQQQMMTPEQYQNMPMMTPQMMHMMMHGMHTMGHGQNHCQQQGMPMTGGGMGSKMMNPQMMQMRMQHMSNMEKRLENIEALLSQLVELQQPN